MKKEDKLVEVFNGINLGIEIIKNKVNLKDSKLIC